MKLNFHFFYRKKKFDQTNVETTDLARVLSVFDLTALGVASTLGSGVYILIGNIMSNYAGPSIILSFIFAGICSFLAGLCYAELGSRVPRSGSAYIYIYVTIGEFMAFIIGWDVILEYVIGTSTAASALSRYIDSLADYQISAGLKNAMPMNVPWLAPYPDFLAFGLAIIITAMLVIGVKESSFLNILFTVVNVAAIGFVVICGAVKAEPKNWDLYTNPNLTYSDIIGKNMTCSTSKRCGEGGFAPFGLTGILKGTAKCFYAYIGFDVIATTGEEVIEPKKTIPLSIVLTLIIVSVCYISVSTIISLMVPYFVFDMDAPLSEAFNYVGLHWASYIVSIGAILSLATSLYASMFPMPRVVYSMASDGLLFNFLSTLIPKLKTPIFASLLTGLLAGLLSLLFDLNQLIDMMSIGTLLAYSLVSACTLSLRYQPNLNEQTSPETSSGKRTIISFLFGESEESLFNRLLPLPINGPTKASSHLVNALTVITMVFIVIMSVILNQADLKDRVIIVLIMILFLIITVLTSLIWIQPQNNQITTFKVPFVPFFPIISAFVNLYLMTSLSTATWVRFIVWFVLGLIVYFSYGIRNSKENIKGRHQNIFFPCIEKSYAIMEEPENETHERNESSV